VGQNNTKDIKQLRQQTELKHASVMEQIHTWRDLLQSNSATADIAQKEIHARIDVQEKAINNLSLDTSMRLHDLEQRHVDIDLRRDDASKSLKLAQLADEATTLQAAHAQSMKERMDNQEAEFVGLKKQVDSQTDLLHQLLPVQVKEAVQERFHEGSDGLKQMVRNLVRQSVQISFKEASWGHMGAASGRNTLAAPEQPAESPDSEIEEHKEYLLSVKDATHQYLSESDFATSNGYYWHQNILWKGTHSWREECIVTERINTETGQSDMLVVWSELDDSNTWTQMSKEDNMWVSHSLTPESLLSEWSTSGRRRAWLCLSGHTITTTADDAPTDRSDEGTDWSSTDGEADDEDGGSKDERYVRQVHEQESYCKDERNNLMKDLNILRESSDDKDEQCEQMSKKIEEL
jgi:hypothetical protein